MSNGTSLKGRVSLIFGGTYGIGPAIARRLAADGSALAVSARNQRPELVEALHETGVQVKFFAGDLGSYEDVKSVVDRTVAEFGRIDVVVVSGRPRGTSSRLFLDTDPDTFVEFFRTRTVTRLYAAHAAARYMKEQGDGRIIFVTSDAGRVPTPAEVLDGTSSAAVIYAARALGRELSRHGIRVNTVSLTLTRDTPAYERFTANQDPNDVLFKAFQKIEGRSPFGLNRPEDVAEVVAFLAGPGAKQISGAVLSVNGGLSFPN